MTTLLGCLTSGPGVVVVVLLLAVSVIPRIIRVPHSAIWCIGLTCVIFLVGPIGAETMLNPRPWYFTLKPRRAHTGDDVSVSVYAFESRPIEKVYMIFGLDPRELPEYRLFRRFGWHRVPTTLDEASSSLVFSATTEGGSASVKPPIAPVTWSRSEWEMWGRSSLYKVRVVLPEAAISGVVGVLVVTGPSEERLAGESYLLYDDFMGKLEVTK